MATLSRDDIRRQVRAALAEDIGPGDVTSLATVPRHLRVRALMAAREDLVVAGLPLAEEAFRQVSPRTVVRRLSADGSRARAGEVLIEVAGPARAVLSAERVALNFVQRLSGIATLTAGYVEKVRGTGAVILDTRKTTPGWRVLEKYAVRCGGGRNHRQGLHDQVLIKDNHLAVLAGARPNPVAAAVRKARQRYPGLAVEVEADTLEQVRWAVAAGADIVLLDNMTLAQMRAAVTLAAGSVKLEASGGIDLRTARAIALTGVDFLSAGALTQSARAVDIGLDFEQAQPKRAGGR